MASTTAPTNASEKQPFWTCADISPFGGQKLDQHVEITASGHFRSIRFGRIRVGGILRYKQSREKSKPEVQRTKAFRSFAQWRLEKGYWAIPSSNAVFSCNLDSQVAVCFCHQCWFLGTSTGFSSEDFHNTYGVDTVV